MGVNNSIKMHCTVSEPHQGFILFNFILIFPPSNTEVSKTSLNISEMFIHLLGCSEYRQAMEGEKV